MRKVVVYAALAAVAVVGIFAYRSLTGVPPHPAAAAPAPPAVTVARPLVREIVEQDEFTGRFAAVEQVELRARVGGHLESIHFRDGAMVREGDLLCRYGGEEFLVILPGSTQEQAAEVAERLRYSIETQAGAAVRDIPGLSITSSFGVASIKLGAKDAPELIDQADNALYQSKQSGRNRVSLWAGERSVGADAQVPEEAHH